MSGRSRRRRRPCTLGPRVTWPKFTRPVKLVLDTTLRDAASSACPPPSLPSDHRGPALTKAWYGFSSSDSDSASPSSETSYFALRYPFCPRWFWEHCFLAFLMDSVARYVSLSKRRQGVRDGINDVIRPLGICPTNQPWHEDVLLSVFGVVDCSVVGMSEEPLIVPEWESPPGVCDGDDAVYESPLLEPDVVQTFLGKDILSRLGCLRSEEAEGAEGAEADDDEAATSPPRATRGPRIAWIDDEFLYYWIDTITIGFELQKIYPWFFVRGIRPKKTSPEGFQPWVLGDEQTELIQQDESDENFSAAYDGIPFVLDDENENVRRSWESGGIPPCGADSVRLSCCEIVGGTLLDGTIFANVLFLREVEEWCLYQWETGGESGRAPGADGDADGVDLEVEEEEGELHEEEDDFLDSVVLREVRSTEKRVEELFRTWLLSEIVNELKTFVTRVKAICSYGPGPGCVTAPVRREIVRRLLILFHPFAPVLTERLRVCFFGEDSESDVLYNSLVREDETETDKDRIAQTVVDILELALSGTNRVRGSYRIAKGAALPIYVVVSEIETTTQEEDDLPTSPRLLIRLNRLLHSEGARAYVSTIRPAFHLLRPKALPPTESKKKRKKLTRVFVPPPVEYLCALGHTAVATELFRLETQEKRIFHCKVLVDVAPYIVLKSYRMNLRQRLRKIDRLTSKKVLDGGDDRLVHHIQVLCESAHAGDFLLERDEEIRSFDLKSLMKPKENRQQQRKKTVKPPFRPFRPVSFEDEDWSPLPAGVESPQSTSPDLPELTIVCYNVLHDLHDEQEWLLQSPERYRLQIHHLLKEDTSGADVILLNEVSKSYLDLLLEADWMRESWMMNSTDFTPPHMNLILVSNRVKRVKFWALKIRELSNTLVAMFDWGCRRLVIANAHFKSTRRAAKQRIAQYRAVIPVLREFAMENDATDVLIGGDTNCNNLYEQQVFTDLGLSDIWLECGGTEDDGKTMDPLRNGLLRVLCKGATRRRRYDRLLHMGLESLSPNSIRYSSAELFGTEELLPGPEDGKLIHLSDHFGLKFVIAQ